MHVVSSTEPSPPATQADIAALEFGAVEEFRRMSKDRRAKQTRQLFKRALPLTVLAVEVVAFDKPELVNIVRERHEPFGKFLLNLEELVERGREAKT